MQSRPTLVPARAAAASLLGLVLAACSVSSGVETLELESRTRTSPDLEGFPSCQAMLARLRANLREEARTYLVWGGVGPGGGGDAGVAFGPPQGDGAEGDGPEEGVDFSGTNNQEVGVDEADFAKTDGSAFYVLNGNRLEIMAVPAFGELAAVSSTPLEGRPRSLLLLGERIVVFSALAASQLPAEHPLGDALGIEDPPGPGGAAPDLVLHHFHPLTKLTLLDASDPAAPRVERELWIDGELRAARRVGSSVRTVSWSRRTPSGLRYAPELPAGFHELSGDAQELALQRAVLEASARNDEVIDAARLADFLPRILERVGSGFVDHSLTLGGCVDFAIAEDGTGRDVTSILTLDLAEPDLGLEADHLVGNPSTVYSSQDVLVLAEPANEDWWFLGTDHRDATNLHRFDVSEPGTTAYSGSGRVEGRVAGPFSLSEHEGFLRVASTTGMRGLPGDPPTQSHVFVLGGEERLELVGQVGGIGVGERLWAARFEEERGFLVTFRDVDPLWTVDLSDPTAPTVAGELEVPGVSTYVHVVGEKLLTVGRGGDPAGLDGSMQVSLFDVGDFHAPALDDVLPLGIEDEHGSWVDGWSEAGGDHKAFQYWAPARMLAVPVSAFSPGFGDGAAHDWSYRSFLELVRVDPAGTLASHGRIDHSAFFNAAPGVFWGVPDVRRSFFLGDFIYTLSDRGITAHRLEDLEQTAGAPLPGPGDPLHWEP